MRCITASSITIVTVLFQEITILNVEFGVKRNQYQDFLQGQEFLHIYLEQVHVQGIHIQVPDFLAAKSSENLISLNQCQGLTFTF